MEVSTPKYMQQQQPTFYRYWAAENHTMFGTATSVSVAGLTGMQ